MKCSYCNKSGYGGLSATLSILGFVAAIASSAHATAYSDTFVADPTSFGCGYYGTNEICGSGALFNGPQHYNPRKFVVGDTIDETIAYSSPINIPGSNVFSGTYIYLPDQTAIGGPSRPGPYEITGSTTAGLYTGPGNPTAYYTRSGSTFTASGYLGGYYLGSNPGFAVKSAELIATVNTSDLNSIYGVSYGYSVFLPATPKLISDIAGGTLGHPAILPTGEVGEITFGLSGQGAQAYYAFDWAGGLFQATGSVASPPLGSSFTYQLEDLNFSQIASTALDSQDSYAHLLSSCRVNGACDLAPGEYIIGVTDDGPGDPMVTVNFGTPVESTLGVPEPGSWAFLLSGLAAVGARVRTRPARRLRS